MTFAAIRAHIESRVNTAFQGLTPAVPVVFDNTLETPPDLPYVMCLISYTGTTELTVCPTDTAVEDLRGSLQISCYVKRSQGMKQLESLAATAMTVMNNLYDWNSNTKIKAGSITGPNALLAGTEPYALVTVSCPFQARHTV